MWVPGIDVSKWQGEMDWSQAADAGASFAFIRASSATEEGGWAYTDFQFDRNKTEAPQHMLVGYYHFLRPYVTAVQQADYFCDLIENVERHLPPVCDIETPGNVARVHEFVDRVHERLGVWPLIYTGVFVWESNYEAGFSRGQCDLWLARYQVPDPFYGNVSLHPWLQDWRFWQWTHLGPGQEYGAESLSIDQNWYNGDYDSLLEYAGIEPTPDVEARLTAIEEALARKPLHTHPQKVPVDLE